MPIQPLPTLDRTSPTFRPSVDAFFATQLPTFSVEVESARVAINSSTGAASASADTATAQAVIATDKAAEAVVSAAGALTSANTATAQAASVQNMDKRYLGAKATAPTLDNQGAALQAGAVYYDTALNQVRTWSGSAWVQGIAAVAGVASVNGASGAVVNIATTGANTFTGDQTLAGGKIISPILKGTLELRATAAIAAGVLTLDLSNAITSAALGANITSITVSNNAASATACQSHTLELTADGTPRTVLWPSGNGTSTMLFKWAGGTAPTMTSASGKRDTFAFKSVSQFLWDAYIVGQNQ